MFHYSKGMREREEQREKEERTMDLPKWSEMKAE
jgi:hypothetical protein